jgi:hypothetical protein
MAVIKNTTKKCQRGCGEKECKLVQPLWKTVWRLLKKLKTTQTLYAHMNKRKNNKKKKLKTVVTLLGMYPKECKPGYNRDIYTHVY